MKKILHLTPITDGYEEVTLLANKVSETNGFAVIKKNNEIFFTGGLLIEDNETNRHLLDTIPKHLQHKIITSLKQKPCVSMEYFEQNKKSYKEEVKHTLEILLKHIDLYCGQGLCMLSLKLVHINVITSVQHARLNNYIHENKPSRFSSLAAFKSQLSLYHWPQKDVEARIKWIKKQIKKLS